MKEILRKRDKGRMKDECVTLYREWIPSAGCLLEISQLQIVIKSLCVAYFYKTYLLLFKKLVRKKRMQSVIYLQEYLNK